MCAARTIIAMLQNLHTFLKYHSIEKREAKQMDIDIVYHHHRHHQLHHHHHHCHLFNNDYTTFSTVNVGSFFRLKMGVVCVLCMLVCVCLCAHVHAHAHMLRSY